MRCPFCDANRDRVVDSRESRDGAVIRRRRECLECGRRFTSYEQIEGIPYMVVKHDGRREEFSRQKLLQGLMTATRKRSITMRKLEDIVDAAEALLHQREDREIGTHEIGALVMERLREIDQVAYVRFASVYRRFDDVEGFQDLLKQLFQQERDASLAGQKSLFEPAAPEPTAATVASASTAPGAPARKPRGASKEPAEQPPSKPPAGS
jgi:transcriptional repressor NrdR